jgi:hypothetical protein
MVSRLLGSVVSLAVAVFSLASVATFFVAFASRHDDTSDLFPFGGWQVDLAAVAIALIGIALLGAGGLGMRRCSPLPNTPRSYQIIAAFIAIVTGISLSATFHHQPERAYNWAAGFSAGAKHEKAQDAAVVRQMVGDATHPPMPFAPDGAVPFPTAPSTVTAPLLRASDLGVDWYAEGPPRGAFSNSAQAGAPLGIRSSAEINLAQEKWNGTRWVQNTGLLESVRRFATSRQARRFTALEVRGSLFSTAQPQPSAPRVRRRQVDGVTVWSQRSSSLSTSSQRLLVTVGSTALFLDVMPAATAVQTSASLGPTPTFPSISDRQIVAGAITRARSAG